MFRSPLSFQPLVNYYPPFRRPPSLGLRLDATFLTPPPRPPIVPLLCAPVTSPQPAHTTISFSLYSGMQRGVVSSVSTSSIVADGGLFLFYFSEWVTKLKFLTGDLVRSWLVDFVIHPSSVCPFIHLPTHPLTHLPIWRLSLGSQGWF